MTEAFIFVNCFLSMTGVAEQMAKATEGVLNAYSTTGIYDLILKVKAADEVQLRNVLQKVMNIEGVAATMTSIIFNKNKS